MFMVLMHPPVLIGAAAALAWLIYFPWHHSIHDLMLKLSEHDDYPLDDGDDCMTAGELRRRIQQLPKVVQEYMKAVCHDAKSYADDEVFPVARTLRIEQDGQFLLDGKFISFTATQEFGARYKHAGFVWDAVMKTKSCIPNITVPVNVCDAYVDAKGIMKAQLPGGIPGMNVKTGTKELNEGELMRWAAEATMFPLSLLPPLDSESGEEEEESLKWLPSEDGDDDTAILTLKHRGTTARMTFHFDSDTHLVTSIKARRPRADNTTYIYTDWEGFFYEYELHGGLIVPTRMEVGWKLEDDAPMEIYFKGTNHNFIYLMNSHPTHHAQTESAEKHAHSD